MRKGHEDDEGKRGRYTLEFKQEAVRLVESGQTMAAAARSLGSGRSDAV
jgi:transposase-like protein